MAKTVLVTGAGTGIGREAALEFAMAGYDVALHYNGSAQGAQEAAEAIRDFAQNEGGGGIAGMGVGMGAGVQVGQVFAGAMNQNMAPRQPAAPAPAPAQTIACASCGAQVPASAKFCTECGKNPQPAGETCLGCGATVTAGAKFCPECGKPLQQVCSKCGAKVTGKFCPEWGTPAGN